MCGHLSMNIALCMLFSRMFERVEWCSSSSSSSSSPPPLPPPPPPPPSSSSDYEHDYDYYDYNYYDHYDYDYDYSPVLELAFLFWQLWHSKVHLQHNSFMF